MLEVQNSIKIIRELTGLKLANPADSGTETYFSKLLPDVVEFIAHERDEGRHAGNFFERIDAFCAALRSISFDGGSKEERDYLESECKLAEDETILSVCIAELQTLVDDFNSQILGSSRQVGSDGFANDEPTEPQDPPASSNPSEDIAPPSSAATDSENIESSKGDLVSDNSNEISEEDFSDASFNPETPNQLGNDKDNSDDKDVTKPLTWRDSLASQEDDDFLGGPNSDDWKQSVNLNSFDTSHDESWKSSIEEDGISDRYISELASTEFDRATEGDTQGYHLSLHQRRSYAESYLNGIKVALAYFESKIKTGLMGR